MLVVIGGRGEGERVAADPGRFMDLRLGILPTSSEFFCIFFVTAGLRASTSAGSDTARATLLSIRGLQETSVLAA